MRVQLDRGVNLSYPASEVGPGQLILARNCHYERDSHELSKVKGRSLFGTVSGGPTLLGAAIVRFRSGQAAIVVSTGSAYYSADPTKENDSFTLRTSGLSGAGRMEGVYYDGTGRAYFSDGINRMQVWTGSGNMRNGGGLRPSAGTLTFLGNTATEYLNVSTFQYCHTEYDSTNDVESPASTVQKLSASAEKGTFKYQFPATLTNTTFNSLRLYRTPHGGDVFYLIAEIPSTNLRYYDGDDTEALGLSVDNDTEWGFRTVDDIFLQSQETYGMIGTPILGNYVTENGQIPRGDIFGEFKGSLYMAGVPGFPEDLYFSLPKRPEVFTPASWVRFGDGRGDPITAAGKANDRLIVFKTNSIHRLTGFPRISAEGLGSGLARRDIVTEDIGCVAKRAVCNFGIGQSTNRIFFLSVAGPAWTDGYTVWPLNQPFDWSSRYFNLGAMDKAVARNYTKHAQIHLWVPSKNSSMPDVKLIYHYHPALGDQGGMGPWTAPIHERCSAADILYGQTHHPRLFIADTDTSGKVYLIDSGTNDAQNYDSSDGKIDWEWETGDDPLGQESKNKKLSRVFLSVVGTSTFSARLEHASDQKEDFDHVPLAAVGETAPEKTRAFGTSTVTPLRTRSYRGAPLKLGTHHRFRMQELADGDRSIAALEVDLEPGGDQR